MEKQPLILVPGTWSWDGEFPFDQPKPGDHPQWYQAGAIARTGLENAGFEVATFPWSTALGGIGFGSKDLVTWRGAAIHLKEFVKCHFPDKKIWILSHSHGLQVVLFAALYGLEIEKLFDVSGPFRRDMEDAIKIAKPNIKSWTHFRGEWWKDRMAGYGGLFDSWDPRTWGRNPRSHPYSDRTVKIDGAGHSTGLYEKEQFDMILTEMTKDNKNG
ncbi:MAG: hypothetical protein AB7J46_06485 [Candidatus Altimarinota bacterium]